jgi:hypothetical protein
VRLARGKSRGNQRAHCAADWSHDFKPKLVAEGDKVGHMRVDGRRVRRTRR